MEEVNNMEENNKKEIENLISQNGVLKRIADLPVEELKILKIYILSNLLSIDKQTENQKQNNLIGYRAIKSCLEENYDYLTYVVNCKQRIDNNIARVVREAKVGEFFSKCRDCKLTECIKSVCINFLYEIEKYNIENNKQIKYLDVINFMLKEEKISYNTLENFDMFKKVKYYDLIFIYTILEDELVFVKEIDENEQKAKFGYVNLHEREGYIFYINKLYDYIKRDNVNEMELDLNNFNLSKNEDENQNVYLFRVAAYFLYLMKCKNLDILNALDEYLKKVMD